MTRGGQARSRAEPERRCIVTGDSGPADRLIRFVLGPSGEIVPDLAGRLPGRGAWLTADRALVDRAVAKKLFSRAFRTQAQVPADLADRLEAMLVRRLIELIGLARKAGQAVTGFEKVRAKVREGGVGALIEASDGAADGREKLQRLAPDIPVLAVLDAAELGLAFGRDFAIHAALDRGGFADRAIGEAARLAGLRAAVAETEGSRRDTASPGDARQRGRDAASGQGD
jgi:predicted RNA-binding protein YlxR (DUF448 family)/ribosomal protein L30E